MLQMMTEIGWNKAEVNELAVRQSNDRGARNRRAMERQRTLVEARSAQLAKRKLDHADRQHVRQVKRAMRDLGLLAPTPAFGPRIRLRNTRSGSNDGRGFQTKISKRNTPPVPVPVVAKRKPARILDEFGRESVFVRFRYLGLKSPGWMPERAGRHARYVCREDVEAGRDLITNMGDNLEEVVACWDAISMVERGYRKNAKVQMRVAIHLPPELSFDQQRAFLTDYCAREFERLNLPYVASVHQARADGRNPHAHIDFSTRPFERHQSGDWSFAAEKIAGVADKDGLKARRLRIAAALNLALRKAGSERRFTHQTYAERGIAAQRQEHLGQARSAALRRGEHVSMAHRNSRQAEVNQAAARLKIARLGSDLADAAAVSERGWVGLAKTMTKHRETTVGLAWASHINHPVLAPAPFPIAHFLGAESTLHYEAQSAHLPVPTSTSVTQSNLAIADFAAHACEAGAMIEGTTTKVRFSSATLKSAADSLFAANKRMLASIRTAAISWQQNFGSADVEVRSSERIFLIVRQQSALLAEPAGSFADIELIVRHSARLREAIIRPRVNDLLWAQRQVRSGRAYAMVARNRLTIYPYGTGREHEITLFQPQIPNAKAIADHAQGLVRRVEIACETGLLRLDAMRNLVGAQKAEPSFVAFATRLLQDEAMRSDILEALKRGKARRIAAAARKKEKDDEDPRARGSATAVIAAPFTQGGALLLSVQAAERRSKLNEKRQEERDKRSIRRGPELERGVSPSSD